MELLQVRNFGKSGLNSDLPQWDLPASFFTKAYNFRVWSNKILTMGGTHQVEELPAGFNPAHIISTPTPSENYWILAGNGFYVYNGALFYDISGGHTLGNKYEWTSCKLGRVPVINNGTTYPVYWDDQNTSQVMQVLPYDDTETWQDKDWQCKAMRSFGPYLIAMNMTEETIRLPDRVRWTHPAEQGMVPNNWNEADPASLASRNDLSGEGGDIIDGLALRNSFVLYRDHGITNMEYSDDSYVFNFNNLTSTIQIANINSIAEVKGAHFIISVNDIIVNTGDKVESLLHNRLRTQYANSVNQLQIESAYAVHNEITKEYWAFLPTEGADVPNQVWKYNYRDDAWSIHDIPETNHADFGALDRSTRIWSNWFETWGTTTGTWARQTDRVLNQTLIGVEDNSSEPEVNKLTELDFVPSDTPYTTILERTEYPLTTMQDVVTVTRVYPHIKSTVPIKIQVGSHRYPGDPARWKPEQTFVPGGADPTGTRHRKLDVMTTGELFAFRIIVDVETTSNFEFSGLDIEYTHAGLR